MTPTIFCNYKANLTFILTLAILSFPLTLLSHFPIPSSSTSPEFNLLENFNKIQIQSLKKTMATLQKFKFLATQCAVIGSPARSPTTSPVIHIRRRKTLRMLLGGKGNNSFNRRFIHNHNNNHRRGIESGDAQNHKSRNNNDNGEKESNNSIGARHKLKDLFVSSPPPTKVPEEEERLLPATGSPGRLVVARRGGVRPLSATLRQRLLMRRVWRPVLVAIPEQSP